MTIRKAIIVECDEDPKCANVLTWTDPPCTEHSALQEALNTGWAQRRTERRDSTRIEHFCPTHA